MSHTISIPSREGGSFDAEVAEPAHGAAPGIIVVPSIYGNTDGLKETLDRYAGRGFIALSIDPFWRTVPGPLPLERREEASARMQTWTVEQGTSDVQDALAALRTFPKWNGKFAILGFCFGGRLAMLGLTRLGADAAVAFHGTAMHLHLDELGDSTVPFSFHYGGDDPVVPMDQVEQIQSALAGYDGEIFVYEGAGHSFAQQESPRYDPVAGPLSEDRAFAILERLKSPAIA
jgi:carboxymethylenebutenolidase